MDATDDLWGSGAGSPWRVLCASLGSDGVADEELWGEGNRFEGNDGSHEGSLGGRPRCAPARAAAPTT